MLRWTIAVLVILIGCGPPPASVHATKEVTITISPEEWNAMTKTGFMSSEEQGMSSAELCPELLTPGEVACFPGMPDIDGDLRLAAEGGLVRDGYGVKKGHTAVRMLLDDCTRYLCDIDWGCLEDLKDLNEPKDPVFLCIDTEACCRTVVGK